MNPEFLARGRVEGDERAALRGDVGHIIDHKRTERVAHVVSGRIAPGDLELVGIANIDLLERRVMGAVGTAKIILPFGSRVLRKTGPE